jgi:hypothetical protein
VMTSCLLCYRKHLGTAAVFENEAKLGYPAHKWLAVGELCAAENEVLNKYPELSVTTREYRKAYMEQDVAVPTIQLINLATELETMEKLTETQKDQSGDINNNEDRK